jgi:zinc transport system substrate-binding protein
MNKKQKILILSVILIVTIVIGTVVAYTTSTPKSDKLSVVTTFYSLTFLAQEIGGDQIQITQLVPSNTELHGWEPSASHIAAAEDAGLIIYNGAGLDHWMEDDVIPALSSTKTRSVVDTTAGLNLIENQEHKHEDQHEEEHEHGIYDPHTWISPYMAKLQAERIYDALIRLDPEHESYYTQRWLDLENRLEQLDNDYSTGLSNTGKNMIFVSHEAFGYLAHRYGFEQHGVIGISADEQPTTSTIANLVEEMVEHQTYTVYVDPVYSTEYAQTLKTEVQAKTGENVNILTLYLMQGQTDNMNLLEQMQANLANLKTGLEATQ